MYNLDKNHPEIEALLLLASIYDPIVKNRTQNEIDHGNPETGLTCMKLLHVARYLQYRV